MKFLLPTQWSPTTEIKIDDFVIRPYKRIKLDRGDIVSYWDSIEVECPENWMDINEWVTFHVFVLGNHATLDWYEGSDFAAGYSKLEVQGECTYPIDYNNIGNYVYFMEDIPDHLNYEAMYKQFKSQTNETKNLVKNYFNSFSVRKSSHPQRKIRDDSFWRVLALFSIIESVIGDIPKCKEKLSCNKHKVVAPHNDIPAKDWIKRRLLEIVAEQTTADQYFDTVWKVRQDIRHDTVHKATMPAAVYVEQSEGEITWDWAKVSESWNTDTVAFMSLESNMSHIARHLLLNRVFGLQIFPTLRPLKSVRVVLGGPK